MTRELFTSASRRGVPHPGPARQGGLGGLGLFLVLVLAAVGAVVALRVGASYFEYWRVQRALDSMTSQGIIKAGNDAEIRKSFDRRAEVEDIHSLRGSDLEITKTGGIVKVTAAYESRVPLMEDVTLVINFHATATAPYDRQ